MCFCLHAVADAEDFLVDESLLSLHCYSLCSLRCFIKEDGGRLFFFLTGFELFFQVTESKTKKMSRKGSTSSTSSSSSSSMMDPLSSVLDGTDPLSLFAAAADPLTATASMVIL